MPEALSDWMLKVGLPTVVPGGKHMTLSELKVKLVCGWRVSAGCRLFPEAQTDGLSLWYEIAKRLISMQN